MTATYLEQLLQDVNGKDSFRQFLMAEPDKEKILRILAQQSMDDFRKRFVRPESDNIPRKSFTIVGGVMVDLVKCQSLDSIRFIDMFLYLIKTGIPIRPDFTVTAPNMLNDVDYLKTIHKAGVTLISFVPMPDKSMDLGLEYVDINSPTIGFLRVKMQVAQARADGVDDKTLQTIAGGANKIVSDLNSVDSWRESLELSDSGIIFGIFDGQEVNLGEVMPPGYSSLGKLHPYDRYHDHTLVTDVVPMSGVNWQVIGKNSYIELLSFVARGHVNPDTGEAHRDARNIGTQMGTNIHRVVRHLFDQEMALLDREAERTNAGLVHKPASKRPENT